MSKKGKSLSAIGWLKEKDPYDVAMSVITAAAKMPLVRVDREKFLRTQFADSEYLDEILAYGPQHVYSIKSLEKMARRLVRSATNKTAMTSFLSGLPSNPLIMLPTATADILQYFGFAIHMAQQIAYLFGEKELFDRNEISEEAKHRIVAYLGVMLGASGAASLIMQTSRTMGQSLAKKFAGQALLNTTWYPLLKKTGTVIGKTITKKTVEKTITKAVPLLGGVISGGLTYAAFRPMGYRLTSVFVRTLDGSFDDKLEVNPDFHAASPNYGENGEILEAKIIEIEDLTDRA